jgi:hypothetical protein
LSAKYGGKYTLSIGILSTAILTLLTPITIKYGEKIIEKNEMKITSHIFKVEHIG